MRTLTFCALALVLIVMPPLRSHAELSERRKAELVERYRDRNAHADDLNPVEREFVLNWILNKNAQPGGSTRYRFTRQLLELGHKPTIDRFELDYPHLQGEQTRALDDLRQPRVLPFIAKVLQKREPGVLPQLGDTTAWPDSVSAAAQMLSVISRSREIPPEVRAWAAETLRDMEADPALGEHLRSIVRHWWKENGAACEREDFAALKPGQPFKEKEEPPELEPGKSVFAQPPPEPPKSAPEKTVSPTEPAPPSNTLWLGIAAGLAGILAAGLWLASRRR